MTKHLINGKPVTDIKPDPAIAKTIVIEDWIMQKDYKPAAVWTHCKGNIGGYVQDFVLDQISYRVVGTKKQISDWAKEADFIVDEVYAYNPIDKGSYWDGICCAPNSPKLPTRAAYNKKYKKELKRYTELYKENKNKLLILRTN